MEQNEIIETTSGEKVLFEIINSVDADRLFQEVMECQIKKYEVKNEKELRKYEEKLEYAKNKLLAETRKDIEYLKKLDSSNKDFSENFKNLVNNHDEKCEHYDKLIIFYHEKHDKEGEEYWKEVREKFREDWKSELDNLERQNIRDTNATIVGKIGSFWSRIKK